MMRNHKSSLGVFLKALFKLEFLAISLGSSIFSLILYLLVTHGFSVQKNLELTDVLTLFINFVFVLLISKSLNKSYDAHRKKKDIYIDELNLFLKKNNDFFLQLKKQDYSQQISFKYITELREEAESLRSLLNKNFPIKTNDDFNIVQNQLRSTDRLLNPGSSFTATIDHDQATLINSYRIKIKEKILDIMTIVNNC